MALFHFSVTQVKRSAGQSAIAAAAYRAGEKLYSEYYGEVSDYTKKGGVIHSSILLPPYAPSEYQDRQTLWNAVEKAEKNKKAQLAYSFDIALQNEFTREENMALVHQFLTDQFLSRGMIVDYAIHEPDGEEGGIHNPHFHVLCPIRPIEKDGSWGNKQRREYVLDEQGNRMLDATGKPVFNAAPTTNWGRPETLESWRQTWAELCNAKFQEKGLACRIDHRSYERQGLDILPTKHEGPTVRAMEAKGMPTNKGELNRWIRATNALFQEAKKKLAALMDMLKALKEAFSAHREPTLSELLCRHLEDRNAGAWSNKAKVSNLKEQAQLLNYLVAKQLHSMDDLAAYTSKLNEQISTLKVSSNEKTTRIKQLEELLRMVDYLKEGKPIVEQLNKLVFKSRREAFKEKNDAVLRRFYMAQRKLKPHFTTEGKLPVTKWRKEMEQLRQAYEKDQQQMRPLFAEVKGLWRIHNMAGNMLSQQRMQQKDPRATTRNQEPSK
jgi:ATP-dependent exoDNAse (exonuclease V) alpha subunit